jgi:fused signal recognition particle receptor
LRCYSPKGHNFYNRHANGLRQKIKAALLSEKQDSYDESLAFQLALHTANCTFGLYAIMKISPFKTMEDYNIAPQTFFEPKKHSDMGIRFYFISLRCFSNKKKMGIFDFFSKEKKETLEKGLSKTKESVFSKLAKTIIGKSKIDDRILDELEEVLITSDVGVDTTLKIISRIEKRAAADKYVTTEELTAILREEIAVLLTENRTDDREDFSLPEEKRPYVIMVVGVNGVGKTTTIGKLAYQFKKNGLKVCLGAADTFRAAAVEQLVVWSERTGAPIIKQKMGSDPASVAYDTLHSAKANQMDVAIIDTAGRLHNKINLMNELTKIKHVMKKIIPGAPHEVLLVLDGSTGQNAFEQAKQFTAATEVNALAITKLDGTAKGGVVIGISDHFRIPVKYIGLGEGIEDLQVFNRKAFVNSLFGE